MTDQYLAIDPGGTTGWATLNELGDVTAMGQVKQKDFVEFFTDKLTSELKHVIVEDYRNYAWKQQKKWSRNDTSKLIGQIEMLCSMRGVPITLQPATCKNSGYLWAGLHKAPANHSISHQYDAVAHGVYWTQVNGIRDVGKSIPKELR
jgi:hypothetical protein